MSDKMEILYASTTCCFLNTCVCLINGPYLHVADSALQQIQLLESLLADDPTWKALKSYVHASSIVMNYINNQMDKIRGNMTRSIYSYGGCGKKGTFVVIFIYICMQ